MIFINYAHEDVDAAIKINEELKKHGIITWFDRESLIPCQIFEAVIKQAIKKCDYFLCILSSRSVNKRGFVNKEIVQALNILDEYPDFNIFIIPIRLDNCLPSHDKINDIHWIDMYPNWREGIHKIFIAIEYNEKIKCTSNSRSKFTTNALIEGTLARETNFKCHRISAYRARLVEYAARCPELLDRGADLAKLESFVSSELKYLWITAPPLGW